MTEEAASLDIDDMYELSPMQLGMLFQTLLEPESGMFVEQQISRVPDVSPGLFEKAWNIVIARTPVLRTSFHWVDIEQPIQVVHRQASLQVSCIDLTALLSDDASEQLSRYLKQERRKGFELTQPPLMRVALVRAGPQDTRFVWHFHHILLDGWSAPLVLQEVLSEYATLLTGRPYAAPYRRPYRKYIDWLQTQDRAAAERYWRDTLKGFDAPVALGIERRTYRSGTAGPAEEEHVVTFTTQESERLRTFARERRLTLNTVFLGAWSLLLSRYSQRDDVVFGAVVSGRPGDLEGVEEMIGLFINTLPVRVSVDLDAALGPWLLDLQRHQLAADPHQHVSTLDIQQWSGLPSGTRLFDSVLIFENFPVPVFQTNASAPTDEPICVGRADVELSVIVIPGKALRVKFSYDGHLLEAASVEQLANELLAILGDMPARAEARLRDLSCVTPSERHRTLVEWNSTTVAGYDEVPLMQLLMERAERTPDATAFVENGDRFSIATVHERSNRLAHYLASQGVGRGTVVGVCRERSVEAVIALLALLKLRAVFLPLDPSYPRDRLAYMAADAGAAVVLGLGAELAPKARALAWRAVWQAASAYPADCPQPHATSDDLAYIIYTSGSMGRPKGVAVEHRTVLNRLTWMWREYPFAPGEIGVMKTALNFVDAFWEMLGGVLRGAPTVVAPQNVVADPNAFIDLLAHHAVTRLWFVPSFLEMILETCPDLGNRLPALRFWSSGGEPISADLYHRFQQAAPSAVLYNVFGTSELWDVTVFDPRRDGPVTDRVPIGRPIANTEAYVLDTRHQPVPVGVTGTLYVSGAPVARGYVNQEALTRQRFIPHPFRDQPGSRLYDTGDLARYRADGVLEYVGRRDLQLNVRGFRVEPAEIEAIIDAHPSARESVVVSSRWGGGNERLVAYVIPRNGVEDTKALLAHLSRWLPSFMMPAITWIDVMPMTPSGKRDRSRLPTPPRAAELHASPRRAPTPLEASIAREFCAVLGVEAVGLDDDFFADLGGHSLLATRLVSKLRASLGVEIPLRVVFDARTATALAAVLEEMSPNGVADEETAAVLADIAALPAGEADALLDRIERQTDGGKW